MTKRDDPTAELLKGFRDAMLVGLPTLAFLFLVGAFSCEQTAGAELASRGDCEEVGSYYFKRCETDEIVCYVARGGSDGGTAIECRWKEAQP